MIYYKVIYSDNDSSSVNKSVTGVDELLLNIGNKNKDLITIYEIDGDDIVAVINVADGRPCIFSVYKSKSELLERYEDIFVKFGIAANISLRGISEYRGRKYNHLLYIDGLSNLRVVKKKDFYAEPNFIYAITWRDGEKEKSGIAYSHDVIRYLVDNGQLIDLMITDNNNINYAFISRLVGGINLNITAEGLRYYNMASFRRWIRWYRDCN